MPLAPGKVPGWLPRQLGASLVRIRPGSPSHVNTIFGPKRMLVSDLPSCGGSDQCAGDQSTIGYSHSHFHEAIEEAITVLDGEHCSGISLCFTEG